MTPQEMSHSKVGQDFRDILMNESDADDAKTDQHFDGHAATNSKMANEIEPMEVLKQFVIDQRSGNVKEMVAALNLACQTLCTLASRCGRCRPIDGEAEVRVTFFSSDAARSSQNSTKVSNLR